MPARERPPSADLPAWVLLGAGTALYTGISLYRLHNYHFLEWDLSIFAQGVWLLSRGETPFVTIRGLHLFGDHATYVHLLMAPFFRLVPDVRWLVLFQSAALAAAGAMLYRFAKGPLGRGAATLVLLAYLAHPALQYTWLEYYQPDSLALPCLVAAFAAVQRGAGRAALLWSLAALVTKENVGATVFGLGLYAALIGRRRIGAALAVIAPLYVVFVLQVLFPLFNEGGYTYGYRLYYDVASDLRGGVQHLARPDNLAVRLATRDNAEYLIRLLYPLAFLPLGAPLPLVAAAQLPLNLVAWWPYARQIRYHHSSPILPFLLLAATLALARLERRAHRRLACAALAAAIGAGLWLDPAVLRAPRDGARTAPADERREREETRALLARIPPEAAVSAHYRFLPHVCLRRKVYMFPDLGPAGTWPEAVVVDLDLIREGKGHKAALDRMLAEGGFRRAAYTGAEGPRRTALYMRSRASATP